MGEGVEVGVGGAGGVRGIKLPFMDLKGGIM